MQKTYQKKFTVAKKKSKLSGCYFINLNKNIDHRGYFFNVLSEKLFFNKFPSKSIKQINLSENKNKGTLRGLHFQAKPFSESKIVMCLKGRIFDVVLDLRKHSKTFGQHISFELGEKKSQLVYIPKNCAHGYQTLEENCIVMYLHFGDYVKTHDFCINAIDDRLKIKWPIKNKIMSKRDINAKSLNDYVL